MKLLVKTAIRLTGLLIAFTVLSSALSVVSEHFSPNEAAAIPLASYEHEYVGDEAVTILGQRIGFAEVSRFCSNTWQLIGKIGALLPLEFQNTASGVLKLIGDSTRSVIEFLVSPRS